MKLPSFARIPGEGAAALERDGLDQARRWKENRDTTVFFVGYLAFCALVALRSFVLYVWIIELGCAVILVAVFMFAYSIKDYSSDHSSLFAGVGFLFAFAFETAYFYVTARSAQDFRLAPPGFLFFISAQWYQAVAFLVVINRNQPRMALRPVVIICGAAAVLLVSFHLFFRGTEILLETRYSKAYLGINACAILLFHAFILLRLRSTWREQPQYFAYRTLASLLSSAAACLGMVLTVGSAPALAFPFYFLRFMALSLCYNANVTFTLLSPYRALYSQLSSRADQLAAANARLNGALAEKEVLLGEVHHRVKNNLQVISSLLSLQSYRNEDERFRDALEESQNRIRAMALVHEMLYQTKDFNAIDFAEYMGRVTAELCNSWGRPDVRIQTACEPIEVPIADAITCGLIANELVSNSLKHAFPPGRAGTVRVGLRALGGDIELSVEDDGVGLPAGFETRSQHSMGFTLVKSLSSQLHGECSISGQGGTRVSIKFPRA
jgi:two-component sensor histidine kinase